MPELADKKIVFVMNDLVGGGVEKNALTYLRGFIDMGLDVELLLFKDRCDYDRSLLEGIPVTSLLPVSDRISRSPVRFVSGFIRAARRADILYGGCERLPSYMVSLFGRLTGIKNIVSAHINMTMYLANAKMPRLERFFTSLACRMSGGVICVSEGVKRDLVESFGVDGSKVRVIYNPVETDWLEGRAGEELSPEERKFYEKPVLINAGRLEYQKGQDTLLRAFAKTLEAGVDARLVILGKGPDRGRLESLAGELGISERVLMPGFVLNPYKYIARAHAFVLSSRFEGLATVVLDSLGLGVPVVSTDCPDGPNELLRGVARELMTPVDDPAALAQSMVRVMRDAGLRERMAAEGKERVAGMTVDSALSSFCDAFGSL